MSNKRNLYLHKSRKSGVVPPAPGPAPTPPPPQGPTGPTKAEESKDFKELRSYMWDNYKYSVRNGLANQDFSIVKESVQAVEDLLKEFPQAADIYKNAGLTMSIGNNENRANVYAKADVFGNINVNATKYTDKTALENSYAYDVKKRFHPQGTKAADIVAHEFGHTLHAALMRRDQTFDWKTHGQGIVDEAYNILKGTPYGKTGGSYKSGAKTKLDMRKDISGYAAETGKPYETVAESVADYYRNRDKAKPLSKEIWKILKRELG